jgi:hypothetical protein
VQGSGPQFASVVPGVPLYEHRPIAGATQPNTMQWLNPNAFISTVDPSTGACAAEDTPQNCQFGNLGRDALRGADFTWSDFYITKMFTVSERVKLCLEGQFLMSSIIPTSDFRPEYMQGCQASLPPRPVLERLRTPRLHRPGCLGWAWVAIAHHG